MFRKKKQEKLEQLERNSENRITRKKMEKIQFSGSTFLYRDFHTKN